MELSEEAITRLAFIALMIGLVVGFILAPYGLLPSI